MEKLRIKGHDGSWNIIATETIEDKKYHLLESEICGDEVPYLIIDERNKLIMDEVWNGFDDLRYALETGDLPILEDEYDLER